MADECRSLPLGGHDCDFVEEPPRKLECPVCLLTLRNPHLLSCCGLKVCETCIVGVKADEKPCPMCKQPFTTLLDKELNRTVLDLPVRCSHCDRGCQWSGELRQLERHVSEDADGSCLFVEISCGHGCGARFLRGDLKEHEEEICPKRPVEVQLRTIYARVEALLNETKEKHEAELKDLRSTVAEQAQQISSLQRDVENLQRASGRTHTVDSLDHIILCFMSSIPEGNIPGVSYYSTQMEVVVHGCCQAELDARLCQFQAQYKRLVRSVCRKSVEVSRGTSTDRIISELNQQYSQTYCVVDSQDSRTIRLVSLNALQVEEVHRLLLHKLKHVQEKVVKLSGSRKISLKMGDISKEEVDVIVSAANKDLSHANSVHTVRGALNRASNDELQKHCDRYLSRYGKLGTGDVAVTKAGGRLKCKHIIHAVGPRSIHSLTTSLSMPDRDYSDILTRVINKVLAEAQKLRASSIAIPGIGAGTTLLKKDVVVSCIVKVLLDFEFEDDQILNDIRLVMKNESMYACFADELSKHSFDS